MFTSEVSGLGCLATSNSFADRRSFRATSAGLKTLAAFRRLFSFLELDLELLAIFADLADDTGKLWLEWFCAWGGRDSKGRPTNEAQKKKGFDKIRTKAAAAPREEDGSHWF